MEQPEVEQTSPAAGEIKPTAEYQISTKKGSTMKVAGLIGIFVVVVIAGVGTGFGLSKVIKTPAKSGGVAVSGAPGTIKAADIVVGKTYGSEDGKKFPDVSDGVVEKGGVDGEGTHHLVRPGGASQTVYMTSSVLDLDLFVGDKVEVKGETFSAQKAAWFMDVGSVKVDELHVTVTDPTVNTKDQQVPMGE